MTWRLFDQKTWPVDLDLLGSHTPDLVDAHTGTDFEDATLARGGQSGSVGAAVGYETQSFGIRGGFDANLYGTSDRLDLTNGSTIQAQGFTDYALSLSTQIRVSDFFSVNAGLAHVFGGNETVANLANGSPRLVEPGGETALQLALNYNFIPERFVISATYAHDFYGNGRDEFYDPAQDTETRGKNGDIVGVKLSYVTP